MRTVPAGVATEIAGTTSALCHLITIERRNGTVGRYCAHQDDLSVGGQTYTAAVGLRVSGIGFELNRARSTAEFELPLVDGTTLDPDDVRNGLWDYAEITIAAASHDNPGNGKVDLWRGFGGQVEITDRGMARFEAFGLLAKAKEIVAEHRSPICRVQFGDDRCQFDLAPVTKSATIVSVSGHSVVISGTAASEADDYWNLGGIIPTSGNGVGELYEIKDWNTTTNTLKTYLRCAGKLTAGDTVNLIPGCDKTRSGTRGCIFWQGHSKNMQAEPDTPGGDALSSDWTDWGV